MRRAVAAGRHTYLRRPAIDDLAEFTRRTNESVDLHAGYVHPASSGAEYRRWIARGQKPDAEQFLVCRRDDDAICGFANLNNIIRGGLQQAFASWCAFAGMEGRGHLTEGVELLQRMAFTSLRLHRIEANIQPGNARSRSLAVRCGFRLEGFSPQYLQVGGVWRDHERWALLADEWRILDRARRGPDAAHR